LTRSLNRFALSQQRADNADQTLQTTIDLTTKSQDRALQAYEGAKHFGLRFSKGGRSSFVKIRFWHIENTARAGLNPCAKRRLPA
jgi:hypothetical protein